MFGWFKKEKPKNTKQKTQSKRPHASNLANFYNFPSLHPSNENFTYYDLIRNSDINDVHWKIARQARSLSMNNPLIQGYLIKMNSEIYGSAGFKVDCKTRDSALNLRVENAFAKWCREASIEGLSFRDIERRVLTYYLRDGEVFIAPEKINGELKITLLDTFAIDSDYAKEEEGIYNGIQFNNIRRPLGYYLSTSNSNTPTRLDAKNIIHFYNKVDENQRRGLSMFASAISTLHDIKKLTIQEVRRGILSATATGFIKSDDSSVDNIDCREDKEDEEQQHARGPQELGDFPILDSGLEPVFTPMPPPPNLGEFVKDGIRQVASSLGISYATFTGDLSDVNYSSIRHGATTERRFYQSMQARIIESVHSKIFARWLEFEVLNRKISSKERNAILSSHSFKAPSWEHIDPYKEANANAKLLSSGQMTLSEYLSSRGKEFGAHLHELQKDKELAAHIGIINALINAKAESAAAVHEDEDKKTTEEEEEE